MSGSKKIGVLDEAVARAAAKAAFEAVKGDDVRVNIWATDHGFTRYAANEVTTSGVVSDVHASVSVAIGDRHATAVVHSLEPARLKEAALRAYGMAELAPADPEHMPDSGAAVLAPVAAAYSDAAARVSPEDRATQIGAAIALAKGRHLVIAGFFEHSVTSIVTATRRGFFGLHHETSCSLSTTARTTDGAGSGWASGEGVRPTDLDVVHATERACDKAERAKGAKPLAAGIYPVVLEAAAVAEVLGFLGGALDARAADEGHSPFARSGGKTRVGEKMFGSLNVRSDPRSPMLPAAPFDHDGLSRTPLSFIEDGVVKRLHMTRYWGKKTGRPADAEPGGIIASGATESTADALIAGLDRGLLVTRFWYMNMIDPGTLGVTGLTRDGVFWVEKGKIVHPVNNFRFNQSVPEMFAAVEAYGAPQRFGGDDWPVVAPSVRCAKFHMASQSDAV